VFVTCHVQISQLNLQLFIRSQDQNICKLLLKVSGARGNIVVKALCCNPEIRGFETGKGGCIFLIYLILPSELGSGVHSASNRNEYQKQKIMFLASRARPVRRAHNLTTIYRLSRQCGILNISQPYRPPRFVTGTVLLLLSVLNFRLLQ
jgi:hypothetical protein